VYVILESSILITSLYYRILNADFNHYIISIVDEYAVLLPLDRMRNTITFQLKFPNNSVKIYFESILHKYRSERSKVRN
jgi:hypothetical protein